ncbi:ATP-binding protein [Galbitalea soli]|uniref:histidine kinase n=1 Tax=Galbitalea soli TaxID=1268042 RepID=A0A7C9TSY9_9MICO|nr:sensor histidine kinase [Galbitalea soli]NYJ31702.1 sensor histidine kinase regulating citrate/malate metabolism [Galbitalea soli]
MFVIQLLAVVVVSGCLTLALWLETSLSAQERATQLSLAVTNTLARDPTVIAAVQGPDPTTALESYTLTVSRATGVDFITIMSPRGIRFTHPDPAQIGRHFLGTISAAQRGRTITETFTGTLGPSVRAVVPIESGGRVVGIVSAGVTLDRVAASLAPRIPLVFALAVVLVLIGSLAAVLARRFLRRVTGSMSPAELTRMVAYYQSVLHSVQEGLILADTRGRVVLYNDEAAELLELPPATDDLRPIATAELHLPDSIAALLVSGARAVEEVHVAGDRVLVVNQEPATPAGDARQAPVGTFMTLRDRTEVQRLSGELASVRTLSEALRAQTHEHANRLHTIVSLLELGRTEQAIELIGQQVEVSQSLADELLGAVGEPALAALLLGKVAQAAERGITLEVDLGEGVAAAPLSAAELVSVVGNLVDNALDAAAAGSPPAWVRVTARGIGDRQELSVEDSGAGPEPRVADRIFDRGVTTKPADERGRGIGLALARGIVESHHGALRVETAPHTRFVAEWPTPGRPG